MTEQSATPNIEYRFPFTAIVGQRAMKRALLLNAVNPKIGGVLVRGKKGTAKSTAVRSLAALLPEVTVVQGCPYNCSPDERQGLCGRCAPNNDGSDNNGPEAVVRQIPIVEIDLRRHNESGCSDPGKRRVCRQLTFFQEQATG